MDILRAVRHGEIDVVRRGLAGGGDIQATRRSPVGKGSDRLPVSGDNQDASE